MVVNTLPSLNPPLFFEIVEDQVYRSNKCDVSSFPFLVTLRLNTVVYLSYDDLSHDLAAFFTQKDINVIHLGMKYRTASSQWKGISEGMAKETVECILDQRRHPILVMCKTGVHFAGTMIGCLRRLQNWSLTSTIDKEEERIALTKGEYFPGQSHGKDDQYEQKSSLYDESAGGTCQLVDDSVSLQTTTDLAVPAYQKYYFYLQGPLVSPSVRFSEKKSIIGDDDDD
uniref:Tyrosine-protein phosphatase domain-containing protein n=1 Tax=Hyaloperonospora arabidopsidis (strain Emoy2) TaxID=559515 RepID=M4BIB9_HYAAE